jgi:hypothetical protein
VTLKEAPYPALPSAGSRADHPDLRQAQAISVPGRHPVLHTLADVAA